MELRAIDLNGFAIGLDALDRPRAGGKPEVFEGVTQFFVTPGGQLGHRHAFLHIRVVALQLLELQGMQAQRCESLAETLITVIQRVVAGIELLALGVVDAQVKGIAVGIVVVEQVAIIQGLEGL